MITFPGNIDCHKLMGSCSGNCSLEAEVDVMNKSLNLWTEESLVGGGALYHWWTDSTLEPLKDKKHGPEV